MIIYWYREPILVKRSIGGERSGKIQFFSTQIKFDRQSFCRKPEAFRGYGLPDFPGFAQTFQSVHGRLSPAYHVNLHWFLTGEGSSGLDPETVEIELLEIYDIF
jgi:hypothetical protein